MKKVPGKGLPWPHSWRALLEHYGNNWNAVAEALDIGYEAVRAYERRHCRPITVTGRSPFQRFGWGVMELPPRYLGDPRDHADTPVGEFWAALYRSDERTDGARRAFADLWCDGPRPTERPLPIELKLQNGEMELHDALAKRAMDNGHTDWSACELATEAMERFSMEELKEMLADD